LEEVGRRAVEFLRDTVGSVGTVRDCLPNPVGWLVRVELPEGEEHGEEGAAAWIALYEVRLDPQLTVVECQRRAIRREPCDGRAPLPEPEEQAREDTAAEPAPEPPVVRWRRPPAPVASPPTPRKVTVSYRSATPPRG